MNVATWDVSIVKVYSLQDITNGSGNEPLDVSKYPTLPEIDPTHVRFYQ